MCTSDTLSVGGNDGAFHIWTAARDTGLRQLTNVPPPPPPLIIGVQVAGLWAGLGLRPPPCSLPAGLVGPKTLVTSLLLKVPR